MPKGKGASTFPTGGKFPVEIGEGVGQRPFTPPGIKGKGVQVFPSGARAGADNSNDPTTPMNPGPVKGKGPQVHKSVRFGDMVNQNQDPSRPYNPKK